MIFQSLEFTGQRPFEHVLIHGLIRDEQGRKMSKSLGNVISPTSVLEAFELEYPDAFRYYMASSAPC